MNIEFSLLDDSFSGWIEKPVPSVTMLPQWYKNIDRYVTRDVPVPEKNINLTVKPCFPFRDALSSGYFLTAISDVVVEHNYMTGAYDFSWSVTPNIIELHPYEQVQGIKAPAGYDTSIAPKWMNPYVITTPPGYSCLFLSPMMHDLPFFTLPGVVDTDTFNLNVNFPFLLQKGFSGTIEKGTPIVQVIPFKRESWTMKEGKIIKDAFARRNKMFSKMTGYYKDYFWKRKTYK